MPQRGGYRTHPDKLDAFMTKCLEILATSFECQFAVAYEVI